MKNLIIPLILICWQFAYGQSTQPWSYDPGPNPNTPMGKELIDHVASIPNMPDVSEQIMGSQKFRPAFGPVNWRMVQEPNTVKILFIGQDATHIAEAAGRTATAGFGGRAQDLAAYFGVNEGAAFINTFPYTIKGQYGAYQTPYLLKKNKKEVLKMGNYVDNELWLMSQHPDSPLAKWRNDLIDWIIRNNKDSLKLIVTFGGSARDAAASYIEVKGGKVGAVLDKDIANIQIPESTMKYAGGNNEFPVPVNNKGHDLYQVMQGKTKIDYGKPEVQKEVIKDITERFDDYKKNMVFTKGGPLKNGLIHPAQLGGYELDNISINGENTRSLKGLKLNDGSQIANDLLVVELPHPTFLSNQTPKQASAKVAQNLKVLSPYVERGWTIPADPGMENKFATGAPYKYSRKDIGPEYYDFGAPGSRMVPVSSASRMSGNANVIVFGTRERADFDMNEIKSMTSALPAENLPEGELYFTRPRTPELRYVFDPGPGEENAKLMKENLDLKKIFKPKTKMSQAKNGIDAYIVKSSPENADFAHYRGKFDNAKVLILADPHGHDDLITSRALTGSRGQHLHGLMKDIGVGEDYLVIRTLPFSMDGASPEDWKKALTATNTYREKLLKSILDKNNPKLIIADGVNAQAELRRLVKDSNIPVVNINRAEAHSSDIKAVANEIERTFPNSNISGKTANIPRSHLTFYARAWEGTSGDRVLGAKGKFAGFAFAEVAPEWSYQNITPSRGPGTRSAIPRADNAEELIKILRDNNLPLPGESVPAFLKRIKKCTGLIGTLEAM